MSMYLPGGELQLLPSPQVTPQLVSAALRRAMRYGIFWRLAPEERALLFLARRLRCIKSPALKEAILKVLRKIWPEKARLFEAFTLGLQILRRKIIIALKIGAIKIALSLLNVNTALILQMGLSALNIPRMYRAI